MGDDLFYIETEEKRQFIHGEIQECYIRQPNE